MTNQILFVLGAQNPEMDVIAALLTEAGLQWSVACRQNGERVNYGIAYMADHASPHDPSQFDEVVFVECGGYGLKKQCLDCEITVVDHHRSGDPGYGKPPQEYLAASSVGQVIALLARMNTDVLARVSGAGLWTARSHNAKWAPGEFRRVIDESGKEAGWCVATSSGSWHLNNDTMVVAAADHCLEAAFQGECPGVDPGELFRYRVRMIRQDLNG